MASEEAIRRREDRYLASHKFMWGMLMLSVLVLIATFVAMPYLEDHPDPTGLWVFVTGDKLLVWALLAFMAVESLSHMRTIRRYRERLASIGGAG